MKTLLSVVATLSVIFCYSQNETVLYESVYITPKVGHGPKLEDAILAHNAKYHAADSDHPAFLQYVVTGKHSGSYVWVMGPGTFTDLDTRPSDDAHDTNWAQLVQAHAEKVSNTEYWSRYNDNLYEIDGAQFSKLMIREYRVHAGMGGKFNEMLQKVIQVFESNKYKRSMSQYWNQFPSPKGRNAAIVWGFNNYAWFDEDNAMAKDFNKINGEGSWAKWLEEWRTTFEWTGIEVRELVTE